MLTYRAEGYAEIARALHISLHPCAHFQHAALLPYRWDGAARPAEFAEQMSCRLAVTLCLPHAWLCRGSFILLADARACRLLPESWRVLPSPALLAVAGKRGQSCTAVCRRAGRCCCPDGRLELMLSGIVKTPWWMHHQ